MGYGPPVEDEGYGYCYRSQHGCGTRLTPYFKTEDVANEFHDFLSSRNQDINILLGKDEGYQIMSLYNIPLYIVQKLASDFEKLKGESILAEPKDETRGHFYQMDYMNYGDDRPDDIMTFDVPLTRTMRKKFAEVDAAWDERRKRGREVENSHSEQQKKKKDDEEEVVEVEATKHDVSKETSPAEMENTKAENAYIKERN